MTQVICDKCKLVIQPGCIRWVNNYFLVVPHDKDAKSWDLCPKCYKALMEFMSVTPPSPGMVGAKKLMKLLALVSVI